MKVKVKVITPVHIGSGQSISPSGYFIDREKGNFNFLNMDSLFRDAGFSRYREEFIRKAATARYIGEIIQDHNLLKKHILYSVSSTFEARSGNPIEVKLFIKSAGRPYIPGSSLKGAIVTALIYYALKELHRTGSRGEIENLLITGSRRNEPKTNNELLNRAYNFLKKEHPPTSSKYGKFEDNSYHSGDRQDPRFLHLLDVSDSSSLKAPGSLMIEKCQVQGAKRGGQIPVLFETLKEGVEAEFEIKRSNCKLEERQILKICHDFYQKVAAADGVKVDSAPFLLRLGQGATAFGTSLLILAQELGIRNYGVKPPRTRKRLIEGKESKVLGFCQLTEIK
mgnify:CR=1 FL=1